MSAFPDEKAMIEGSLAGSHEAFAGIVAKYLSLVCSVGYSMAGDVARSEVAQSRPRNVGASPRWGRLHGTWSSDSQGDPLNAM